jgi:NitT/TauT family transport system permease protein
VVRSPVTAGLCTLLLVAILTEFFIAAGLISPFVIPLPSRVVVAVGKLWTAENLPLAFAVTLAEAAVAVAVATVVAVPAGYVMWRLPVLGAAYRPWLGALFAAPTVLLYPLFLVLFGRSHTTVVVMGALTAAIPISLNVLDGLAGVSGTLENVGRSFNVTGAQMFWKIQLPAAAPTIFVGLRLGLIYALVNVIGIEFLIVYGGLGRVVSSMYDNYEFPGMYAAIIFIVLTAFLLFWVLQHGEKAIRTF